MRRIWKSFLTTWRRQTAMQIATGSVLAATFAVNAGFMLLHQNLETLLTRWGQEIKISVYLRDEATEPQVTKVREFLHNSGFAGAIEYVSKEAAIERFREKMGQFSPGIFADPDFANPLPASFEVTLKSGISRTSQYGELVQLAKQLTGIAGVEEVSYGQGWVENYASVLKVFSWVSGFLLFVLLCGGLFVVGNSIRNSIHQRRDEIAIYELFGATKSMIQIPYVVEGALMGFASSVLAVVMVYVLYRWQAEFLANHLQFWGFTSKLEFLSFTWIGLLCAGGAALGALGAYLCVRQVNTGWAASETGDNWSY